MSISVRLRNALAAVAVALCTTSSAWSCDTPADCLNDFTHYAIIAHVEMASSSAEKLLDSGVTDAELATLVDEGAVSPERFERAISRAMMVPELQEVASELAKRVEDGRLALARDPKRIEEAIEMLGGVLRAQRLARQRLTAAGEYAVPALLRQVVDGNDEQLKLASQTVLIEIGRHAVTPLCEALPHLTGNNQRIVCDILGAIQHPHAAPYLRELELNQSAPAPTREAASRAFRSCGGASNVSLSGLYTALARQYFDGHESLIAYPMEETNNVWSYDHFSGLSPTPVTTAIYSEVMAVRTASHALKLDSSNTTALALFVAANLKRENDLPEGAVDPVYGDNNYSPDFYATVFGTQICLDVLGLAIDKVDTPLVRDAIAALAKTTGGANLFARGSGRQPLLEALQYPDRRVQYEAALTLARALPQERFAGSQAVVPILGSAVRMGDQVLALVIADDPENRQIVASQLNELGFAVVGSGASVAEVQPDIGRAVGVDLVVLRMRDAEQTKNALASLRRIPKAAAAPALVMAPASDLPALRREYRDDLRVNPARAGISGSELSAAIEYVMNRAVGGRMSEIEAEEYTIRSLAALRDIAISRCPAYEIRDAEMALIDALETRSGGVRMLVADILALIDSEIAQRKLFDAALIASDHEQVELLARVADSVRLFGDRAERRHLDAIVDLVANSTGETADAAAVVHGALNLPTSDAITLIP